MKIYTIKIGKDGRFTLPVEIRRKLDLHTGDVMILELQGDRILLRKATPEEQQDAKRKKAPNREGI